MGFGGLFDRATASPSGGHVVLYAERGTKAIVVDMRESFPRVVRELDRSFYHAETSDCPVAVGRLRDGREVVAHCPDHCAVLEIEELESGRRLTEGPRGCVRKT